MSVILKPIKGFECRYSISEDGQVWSHKSNKWLKPSISIDNYKKVTLSDYGVLKYFRVNRLVAEAFIPNPNNLPFVHHKDDNSLNNCKDNLEWIDNSGNQKHAYAIDSHDQFGERNPNCRFTTEEVRTIKLKIANGVMQKLIAEEYSVSPSTISNIATGKRWIDVD